MTEWKYVEGKGYFTTMGLPYTFYDTNDKVPTIHFVCKMEDISCSFRLDKPEWVNNLKDEKPTDKLDLIQEWLQEKDEEFPEISHYELARRLCNLNCDWGLPKMDIPNYLEMK